jgi:carbon-monoxide dehydrogenase medium subunit
LPASAAGVESAWRRSSGGRAKIALPLEGEANIAFYAPRTLAEAIRLLDELENARILAGGTDLLVDIFEGKTEALNLISIQALDELKGIGEKDGRIEIGALATPREIAGNRLIKRHNPALVQAAGGMASSHIRSMATMGGNIVSAVPSADLPPTLMAAEAAVRLVSAAGIRELSLLDFFTGPRCTVCGKGEILAAAMFPPPPPGTGISWERFSLRESNALAVASVAARLTVRKGTIAQAAVVLGAVAPTPLVAVKTAAFLSGQKPSADLFAAAASLAGEECRPISDIRGSAWFRKEIVQVLTRRALAGALSRAQENQLERNGPA